MTTDPSTPSDHERQLQQLIADYLDAEADGQAPETEAWLAEHPETLPHRGPLDEAAFTYRWQHPDPHMDQLQKEVSQLVEKDAEAGADASATFYRIEELANGREPNGVVCSLSEDRERAPRLTESWFC